MPASFFVKTEQRYLRLNALLEECLSYILRVKDNHWLLEEHGLLVRTTARVQRSIMHKIFLYQSLGRLEFKAQRLLGVVKALVHLENINTFVPYRYGVYAPSVVQQKNVDRGYRIN